MKNHPINPDQMNEVDVKNAVNHEDSTPRLPHERDEVPDPEPIDRTHSRSPGNKIPSRNRADS